jgi:hypothetical protein
MARKAEPTQYWEAEVELQVFTQLGFSVMIDEFKEKSVKIKEVRMDNFVYEHDGKQMVCFDIGKRLKGWIRQTLATVKGKSSVITDRSQHGLWCKSKPDVGFIPIAELSELQGMTRPDNVTRELKLPEGMTVYPQHEYGLADGGKRSFTAFFYTLPPPRILHASITSFVKGIDPDFIKDLCETIGQHAGLGDRHSQAGMGLFKVNSWDMKEERQIA